LICNLLFPFNKAVSVGKIQKYTELTAICVYIASLPAVPSRMKVILYCYAFYPSIGGIESVTKTLAETITKMGYDCTVITETPSAEPDNFPFKVKRRVSNREMLVQMKQHDVICNIELSMKCFMLSKIARRPLVWVHNGYKLSCIDAVGWYMDGPAPMTPWASILFYLKCKGLFYAAKEGFKLYSRRWASKFIFKNIAASKWIAMRQPLKNQVQIYPPFTVNQFFGSVGILEKEFDFLYFGRLVSEKGVDVLLRAFKLLLENTGRSHFKLAIVGYGSEKSNLEKLCRELELTKNVFFLGPKRGKDLIDILTRTEITVVPSSWEEPLGGVALEAIASGRIPIISRNGGLLEIVGHEGMSFTNGDWKELSEKMNEIVDDPQLREKLKSKRLEQLEKFDTNLLTAQFLDILQKAVK
jgi:glycosyltransferase involved in cell wall biosynthesis